MNEEGILCSADGSPVAGEDGQPIVAIGKLFVFPQFIFLHSSNCLQSKIIFIQMS